MKEIEKNILTIDQNICENIEIFNKEERGLLSQNILKELRDFVEHISLLTYSDGKEINNSYDNIKKAINYIKSKGNFSFLSKFHDFLQNVSSHYTYDKDSSERLMLKYYEYLLKIKSYLKEKYNLEVLQNIDKFPLNMDQTTQEYYEKIVQKINNQNNNSYPDRYYIQKIKPFFVNKKVYSEVTFTRASDNISKFDRLIAYTKFDIPSHYAIKLWLRNDSINILDKDMPIRIIEDWVVSIRPCELNNFASIFGLNLNISSGHKEYKNLMRFLTKSNYNLVDLVTAENYEELKIGLTKNSESKEFLIVLDKCNELIQNNANGSNVIKYLLYSLKNKIIKQQQFDNNFCNYKQGLKLKYGCIPFDQMPFCTSLVNHNPSISDLFECLDFTNREHEFLARIIKNNTEIKGELYTKKDDICGFEHIDSLIKKYNDSLYKGHNEIRSIKTYNNFVYISKYESDTIEIIKKIKELTTSGVRGYKDSVDYWLKETPNIIDCDEKKEAIRKIFEKSHVAIIYGAAGTGKSTLINHISQFFNEQKKLFLANTNPAVDNLKGKVHASNCEYKTITKFLSQNQLDNYGLLFVDECSTVSNKDMVEILKKVPYKLLILVGDTYQIEAIRFGNWFSILKKFIPEESIAELTKPYRAKNKELLDLWDKVRSLNDDIVEYLVKKGYTTKLDNSIFEKNENEDEIILLLNYDGFYGINNINIFLQANNRNNPIYLGEQIFKIGDPILFNETKRFGPAIYNNLKGKIVGINNFEDKIQFDIEVCKSINEIDISGYDCELIENLDNNNSIIRINIKKYKNTDEDDESPNTVIPFQIAYAVSIHKAQGLEYDSVKIVISNEIDELITHSIFYTAITRAKEKLKIYWTPETENKVLKILKSSKKNIGKDIGLLKSKLKDINHD